MKNISGMNNDGDVSKIYSVSNKEFGECFFRVWTPAGFKNGDPADVIFIYDGQMVFGSGGTWNGLSWNLDKTAADLIRQDKILSCIIVAIHNGGQDKRYQELLPENVFQNFSPEQKKALREARYNDALMIPDKVKSNALIDCVARCLYPYVKAHYALDLRKNRVFVMGASMGGLAALYTLCEFPDVFSGAACLSSHWPGVLPTDTMNEIQKPPVADQLIDYFKGKLSKISNKTLYFDYGDQGLDADYPVLQQKMDHALTELRYSKQRWVTKYFPGEGHSELAWGARAGVALEFLLTK